MRDTAEYGNGFVGSPFAGFTLTAATGIAELLIATGTGLAHAARSTAAVTRKAAALFRGTSENAPHIAMLRVPGEFVAGTWRRV